MSGPKVVRVITREELEAICRRQIAFIDAAISQVRNIIKRYGLNESALEAAFVTKRNELARLIDAGNFSALLNQAPALVEYFRSEVTRLEAKAIAGIEAAKARRRRLSDAARSVANALAASGQVPSEALLAVIAKSLTADDEALKRHQKIVDEAFKSLARTPTITVLTESQKNLAARLGAGGAVDTLAGWLDQQALQSDPQTARLDKVLAELEHLGDPATIEAFSKRSATIASEASPNQRRLLTDSLVLDAADSLRRLKEVAALRTQLGELQGALAACSTEETSRLATTIAQALAAPAMPDKALVGHATAAIEQAQRSLAASARRRAVLEGLATLGYEVRETMATAWARDGRLVVRKPGATDYGVELAAPEDAARLQVRLVGAQNPAQPRGATRDRDQETTWCSEFSELRKLIAKAGGEIQIERALEVGAQAVKTVPFVDVIAATDVDHKRPLERRL